MGEMAVSSGGLVSRRRRQAASPVRRQSPNLVEIQSRDSGGMERESEVEFLPRGISEHESRARSQPKQTKMRGSKGHHSRVLWVRRAMYMYSRGFSKYSIIDLPFHAKIACTSEIFRPALEAQHGIEAIEEGLCAGDTADCPNGNKFRQTL